MTLTKGFQCIKRVGLKTNERREIGILRTLRIIAIKGSENLGSSWRRESRQTEFLFFEDGREDSVAVC